MQYKTNVETFADTPLLRSHGTPGVIVTTGIFLIVAAHIAITQIQGIVPAVLGGRPIISFLQIFIKISTVSQHDGIDSSSFHASE